MENIIRNTTGFAMYMIHGYIQHSSTIVDATCGNGHDTLSLAQCRPKQLFAFDIQQKAISETEQRLRSNGFSEGLDNGSIKLICDSHEYIDRYISVPVDIAVFNLGYLPGSDKKYITSTSSTISAVKKCLSLLVSGGLISITMYSGHTGGSEEKSALLEMASSLDASEFHVSYVQMLNQHSAPPELLLITKK